MLVSQARFETRLSADALAPHVLWCKSHDALSSLQLSTAHLDVQVVDVTKELERAWIRGRNRAAHRARAPLERLDPRRYVARAVSAHDELDLRVEVGVFSSGRRRAQCLLAPEDKLLRALHLDGVEPARMTWIWRGRELSATALWDDIERDEASFWCALTSVALIPEALRAWHAASLKPLSTSDARAFRATLTLWCQGREAEAFFKALSFWDAAHLKRYRRWRALQRDPLFELARYAERAERSDLDLLALARALGPLGELAIVERLDGGEVTLAAILSETLERGRLAVVRAEGLDVSRRHARALKLERLVVVLDPSVEVVLGALCGVARLQAYEAQLARLFDEQRFLAMRREPLSLSRTTIARQRLNAPGLRGEVGLLEG